MDRDFVRDDAGMTAVQWKRAEGDFVLRHGRAAEPWQIASGRTSADAEYVAWISKKFEVRQAAQKTAGSQQVDAEIIKRLQNLRVPEISSAAVPKNEGRVFRGLEGSLGDTAAKRKAAVDSILANIKNSNMDTNDIFNNFIRIMMNLDAAVQKYMPGTSVVREVQEWTQTIRAYVVPVAASLKTVAPELYLKVIELVTQAVVMLVPQIVGWINDILLKAGKEAITYTVTDLVAGPIAGPVLGVIL